jgi:hypothetical protein
VPAYSQLQSMCKHRHPINCKYSRAQTLRCASLGMMDLFNTKKVAKILEKLLKLRHVSELCNTSKCVGQTTGWVACTSLRIPESITHRRLAPSLQSYVRSSFSRFWQNMITRVSFMGWRIMPRPWNLYHFSSPHALTKPRQIWRTHRRR